MTTRAGQLGHVLHTRYERAAPKIVALPPHGLGARLRQPRLHVRAPPRLELADVHGPAPAGAGAKVIPTPPVYAVWRTADEILIYSVA